MAQSGTHQENSVLQHAHTPQPPSFPTRTFTVRRDVSFIDARVLAHLEEFDFYEKVMSREPFIVGRGSFSDVFKGVCQLEDRGLVMTAMKRLRLHVDAIESKNVSLHRVMHHTIVVKRL